MNQMIRMRWKGLSDYPSNSQNQLEGSAVGLFVRYPLLTRLSRGGPFEVLA